MTLRQAQDLAKVEQDILALHNGSSDYAIRQDAIALLKDIRDGLCRAIKAGDPVRLREIA